MNAGAARLIARVLSIVLVFTVSVSALLALLTSHFLVLSGPVAVEGAETLAEAVLVGGVLSLARTFYRLRKYRYVIRSLAVGSRAIEPTELFSLSDEPAQVVFGWLATTILSIGLFLTALRPKIVGFSTSMNLT